MEPIKSLAIIVLATAVVILIMTSISQGRAMEEKTSDLERLSNDLEDLSSNCLELYESVDRKDKCNARAYENYTDDWDRVCRNLGRGAGCELYPLERYDTNEDYNQSLVEFSYIE